MSKSRSNRPGIKDLGRINRLLNSGRRAEAAKLATKLAQSMPEEPEVWLALSTISAISGNPDEAVAHARRAVGLAPGSLAAHLNIANAEAMRGNFPEALRGYERARELAPEQAGVWANLGNALRIMGRTSEAIEALNEAIRLDPRQAHAYQLLGAIYRQQGRYDEAIASLVTGSEFDDRLRKPALDAIKELYSKGGQEHCLGALGKLVRIAPQDREVVYLYAAACADAGDLDKGIEWFKRLIEIWPDDERPHAFLGNVYVRRGQFDLALGEYAKGKQKSSNPTHCLAGEVDALHRKGEDAEAYRRIRELLDRGVTDLSDVLATYAAICRRFGDCGEALSLLRGFAEATERPVAQRISAYYAIGNLLDKATRYDEAFDAYRRANDLTPTIFEKQRVSRQMDGLIELYDRKLLEGLKGQARESEKLIFILGMPRSGTTLVEQILGSHPSVCARGELEYLNEIANDLAEHFRYPYAREDLRRDTLDSCYQQYMEKAERGCGGDYLRITDKMPNNFLHIGLIALLFPRARIIHCRRDPRDTCLSIYFQSFLSAGLPYSTRLDNLGWYYRQYGRLMTHWKEVIGLAWLDVRYEDLVADLEQGAREIVGFCDLDWDDRCLEFHKSRRAVATASYEQVRQPVYRTSVARWHNYERHLGELLGALKER